METSEQNDRWVVRWAKLTMGISALAVIVVAAYFIVVNWADRNELSNVSKTGPLGDTFNGIVAPVIMLCMAALTFLAFYVQYKFNRQQLAFNSMQIINSSFFELFKLHTESVRNLRIDFNKNEIYVDFHNPKFRHLDDKTYRGKDYFMVLRYFLWDEAWYYVLNEGKELKTGKKLPYKTKISL